MSFLNDIIGWLGDASGYFYGIYLDVYYWIAPFNAIAPIFFSLHSIFASLSWGFYYFNQWVDSAQAQLANILSWSTIVSYIKAWLPGLENAVNWFLNAWNNVLAAIGDWWGATQPTVQGWIDSAKQFLQTQINSLSNWLAGLEADVQELLGQLPSLGEILAWFGDWWANILTRIEAWWDEKLLGINSLIESTLRAWFPFYDELAELWSDIRLFFTDPLQWLYDRLDAFFERFW